MQKVIINGKIIETNYDNYYDYTNVVQNKHPKDKK